MDDNFNPYHRWLGIPPQELPADHYRLLGLAKFEDDLDVIKDASERQIAHVRKKALGKYQDLSQKILNELAGARSILLNASDKKAYDAQLQARLAPPKPAIRIPQTKPIPTPTPPPPFPETKPPTPVEIPFPPLVNNDSPRATSPRKKTPQKAPKFQLPKIDLSNKTTQLVLAGIGIALVLMILVASWAIFGGSGTPKKTEENQQELTQADGDPQKKVVEEPTTSPQPSPTDPAKTAIPDAPKPAPKDLPSTAKLSPPPVPNILPLNATITTNTPPPPKPSVSDEPSPAIPPFDAPQARAHQEAWGKHFGTPVETTNSIDMKLVICPPGEFMMGSPDTDKDAGRDEKPQHHVKIPRPFYFGMYEVTQKEFRTVTGRSPWQGKPNVQVGDQNAASYISWDDAAEYCQKLSTREGKIYRLPTEAEWEYACRAGTTTRFSFGDDETKLSEFCWWGGVVGNGNAKIERYVHVVGTKKPNAYGLYDMQGNVLEWCKDYFVTTYTPISQIDPTGPSTGSNRVIRGGDWSNYASNCRGAYRNLGTPSDRHYNTGFRIVCEVGTGLGTNTASPLSQATASSPSPPANPIIGSEPPPAIAPFEAPQARAHQEAWAKHLGATVETTNSIDMKLVLCPPGEFLMGSPNTDNGAESNEKLQHHIKITRPFYIGMYEVTQKEFRTVTGNSPWQGKRLDVQEGDQNAASWISWDDAVKFCQKLSTREGRTYRLPTEAEWEYACRAGTTTRFSFGDDQTKLSEFAWWGGNRHDNAQQFVHVVGTKKPNAFGLYDIHGNVMEWCQDKFYPYSPIAQVDPTGPSTGSEGVIRGGSWGSNASGCRSACRGGSAPLYLSYFHCGFRIVRVW